MDVTTQYILDSIISVQEQVRGDISYFITWGRGLAAFGALYMVYIVFDKMQSAQIFSWDPIIRILVVVFFLGFYPSILNFTDNIINNMGNVVHESVLNESATNWQDNIKAYYYEKGEEIANNLKTDNETMTPGTLSSEEEEYMKNAATNTENSSAITKIWDTTVKVTTAIVSSIKALPDMFNYIIDEAFDALIVSLLQRICMFLLFCLMGIRVFFLTVLYLLGPIAIGFSLFPGFENTIINWAGRYIKTSLWLPIGFLLEGVLSIASREVLANLGRGNEIPFGDTSIKLLVLTTMSVMAIICYSMVPKLAGWIINASGIASAASQLKQNMKSPAVQAQNLLSKKVKK